VALSGIALIQVSDIFLIYSQLGIKMKLRFNSFPPVEKFPCTRWSESGDRLNRMSRNICCGLDAIRGQSGLSAGSKTFNVRAYDEVVLKKPLTLRILALRL
jgi:hypothetical protein